MCSFPVFLLLIIMEDVGRSKVKLANETIENQGRRPCEIREQEIELAFNIYMVDFKV